MEAAEMAHDSVGKMIFGTMETSTSCAFELLHVASPLADALHLKTMAPSHVNNIAAGRCKPFWYKIFRAMALRALPSMECPNWGLARGKKF